MYQPSKLLRVGLFIVGGFVVAVGFTFWSWSFTTRRLNTSAQSIGVFPSPTEGLMTDIRNGYVGIQEAWIREALQENFFLGGGPHVWFATVCVWAESRADGSPVGSFTHDFDYGGSYFVNTQEGWVLMPESSSPLFVGFWMKVFGLAGTDIVEPVHTPPSKPVCVRKAG